MAYTFGPSGHAFVELGDPDDPEQAARRHELFLPGAEDPRRLSMRAFLARAEAAMMLIDLGRIDALAFAGGYWMHDLNPTNLAVMTGLLRLARSVGRRVGVIGIGAGPLTSAKARGRVCKALDGADALTVRDEQSRLALESAGVNHVIVTADPALELPSAPDEEAEHILSKAGIDPARPFVAVSPCAWFRMSEFYNRSEDKMRAMEQSLASIAGEMIGRGLQVLLIATMAPEDVATSERIASMAGPSSRIAVVRGIDCLPGQVQAIIERSRLLIAMRLHSVIFGLNARTPVVAINYDAKVESLCGRAGLGPWLVEPGDGGFGDRALDLANALLDDPSPQLDAAAAARPAMIAALEGNAEAIKRLAR